ncbi:MAG TPA: diaminopropionate ammonia-lyase [Allosphingosinicella sp.]|jgi:diaminopropionate ammonia-lyase
MDVFANPGTDAPPIPADWAQRLGRAGAAEVLELLAHCPNYSPTPLLAFPALAAELGLGHVFVKDETHRLGLNSFKALGGAFATLRIFQRHLCEALAAEVEPARLLDARCRQLGTELNFVCASDGNHGLAVAAGARLVGARCTVYLHQGVGPGPQRLIEGMGARVDRRSPNYDEAVRTASKSAATNGWILVSDTAEDPAEPVPLRIMQGYSVIAHETVSQLPPGLELTHLFVQAGVGGLAAAMAAYFRDRPGPAPRTIVVEPERAACLLASARAGTLVELEEKPATAFYMLECHRPSAAAWPILRSLANMFVAIGDESAGPAIDRLRSGRGGDPVLEVGVSGAAGMAALLSAAAGEGLRGRLALDRGSSVLLVATEGRGAAGVGPDSSASPRGAPV